MEPAAPKFTADINFDEICKFVGCILAAPKVGRGCVPPCDSVHSWLLNSAAPLGEQAAGTIIRYPPQPVSGGSIKSS